MSLARVTYVNDVSGGRVTLVEGSPAEAVYRRDSRWSEVSRAEPADVPAEPERLKPAERAEARAAELAATEAAAGSPEAIAGGNVGDVKAAVSAGGPELAAAVLEAERSGRNRTTLVAWLAEQAGDSAPPAEAEGDVVAPAEVKPGVEAEADPGLEPADDGEQGDGDAAPLY